MNDKNFIPFKENNKMKYTETPVSCFSARNLKGTSFLLKETVK